MAKSSEETTNLKGFWDHISEYEIDPSWRNNHSKEYLDYRKKFEQAKNQNYNGNKPRK